MHRKFNASAPYGTIDGGGSKLFVRFGVGDDDVAPMSRNQFLGLKWLDEGRFSGIKQFAGEYAHLAVPQTEASLSQIYSAKQLMVLYDGLDERGVSLFYLPEKQFSKISWEIDEDYAAKDKKNDETDTLIWFRWLSNGYTENLQPAIRDVDSHRESGRDYKQLVGIVNSTLNMMRHGRYMENAMYTESEFFPDGYDHAVRFMRDWCPVFDKDTKGTQAERNKCVDEMFRTIGTPKTSMLRSSGVFSILQNNPKYPMSTAVAALINPRTGETHRKSNGKFRSVDEIMRVVGNPPNHGKMGVARSNLYWHLIKHESARIWAEEGFDKFKKSGKRSFSQCQIEPVQAEIHRRVMSDVRRATRVCVKYVQKCLQGGRVCDRLF